MGKSLKWLLFASLIGVMIPEAHAAVTSEQGPQKVARTAKSKHKSAAKRDVVIMGSSDLRFELSWLNCDDVDLHVIEPSGFEIYWDDTVSPSGGALVRDENALECQTHTPTEIISWPSSKPPSGLYRFMAHFYDTNEVGHADYTMKVIAGGVVVQTNTGTVSEESPNSPEYTFNYGGSAQILSFTANPDTIAAGGSSTLAWSTQNATSVSIDHGVGAKPASGSVTVHPDVTTTYVLTATASGGTVHAAATVTVTGPRVIVGKRSKGLFQPVGVGGATDAFTLSNVGEAATTVNLSPAGGFFTLSPSSFQLTPGNSQIVKITGLAQQTAGFKEGTVTATGTGVHVPPIPVRLLVAATPVGSVRPKTSTPRAEVSGAPGHDVSGSVDFTNTGTATLTGIAVANVPWIIPQSGLITIPAGQTRSVTYTIDTALRPDGGTQPGAATGTISLVYVQGSTAATSDTSMSATTPIETLDTPPASAATFDVTLVHVVQPDTEAIEPDPLAPGELALFASGLANRSNALGDLLLANRQDISLTSVQLFLQAAGAGSLSTSIPQLLQNSSVAFPGLVKNVFASSVPSGTAQVRGTDTSKISVAAVQTNTSLPAGTYSTALPIFRSDRAIASADSIMLAGLKKDSTSQTDLFVQEVSGQPGNFSIEYLNNAGQVVGTVASQPVGRFGFVELRDAISSSATTARIKNLGGAAKLVAFGLVTNTTTGDAWPVTDPGAGGSTDTTFIVPIFRTPPSGGTVELFTTNRSTSSITVTVDSLGQSQKRRSIRSRSAHATALDVQPAANLPVLPAHTTVTTITAPNGYLRITAPVAKASLAARSVWTNGAAAYGSGLPVVPASAALGLGDGKRFAAVSDASETSRLKSVPATFRTNLAFVETTGQPATVRATLQVTFPGGELVSVVAEASKDFTVAGGKMLVIDDIASAIFGPSRSSLDDLNDMTLDVEVIDGSGHVVPFLQSIDNGSGDMMIRTE
jgi:hypothetical protein